jgi:hypothetical protein
MARLGRTGPWARSSPPADRPATRGAAPRRQPAGRWGEHPGDTAVDVVGGLPVRVRLVPQGGRGLVDPPRGRAAAAGGDQLVRAAVHSHGRQPGGLQRAATVAVPLLAEGEAAALEQRLGLHAAGRVDVRPRAAGRCMPRQGSVVRASSSAISVARISRRSGCNESLSYRHTGSNRSRSNLFRPRTAGFTIIRSRTAVMAARRWCIVLSRKVRLR